MHRFTGAFAESSSVLLRRRASPAAHIHALRSRINLVLVLQDASLAQGVVGT
jgi:hypothetical protein